MPFPIQSCTTLPPAPGVRPVWLAAGTVFHTATLLTTGHVLVAGGHTPRIGGGDSLAVAQLFDPSTRTWTRVPNLRGKREMHTAVSLADGRVLVAGGFSGYGGYPAYRVENVASAEVFDPVTATWADAGNLNAARGTHTATLLRDGSVLVVGGSIVLPDYTTVALDSVEHYGE